MTKETHLFIIWDNARKFEKEILEDIAKDLTILKTIEIRWSRSKFSNNLSRFYGTKLHRWSFKDIECGHAPFLLVVVEDDSPKYEERLTSRGSKIINSKMFDKKTKYRSWLGKNNSKVHGTNSEAETRHDLMLLLGLTIEEFRKTYKKIPNTIKQNLVGCNGWDNLEQLFKVLNETIDYVVLRNYDFLPKQYKLSEHGDIDLLVDNEKELARLLVAKKVSKKDYRVNYRCRVGEENIKFDFRHVGDRYYDTNWEKQILAKRVKNAKGIYVPEEEDYKYSLLYHALIHKKQIASDYKDKLNHFFSNDDYIVVLKKFISEKNYKITRPKDLSVYFNEVNAGIPVDVDRKKYHKRIRRKQRIVRMIKK